MAKGKKTGGGNRKGKPNKATADARAAIALFVDSNAHRLQEWLDGIANGVKETEGEGFLVAPNPVKAFELFQSVIEYHVPKLARNEVTGANNGPIQSVVQLEFVDKPK